ncbi:hypothetical protein K0M31_001380, partial [Melipona bicolor]
FITHTLPAKSNFVKRERSLQVPGRRGSTELANEATNFFYIKHTVGPIGHRLNRNQEASSNEHTVRRSGKDTLVGRNKTDNSWKALGEPLILGVRDTVLPMSRQRFEGSRHRSLDVSSGRVPRSPRDNEISPAANLFPNSRASGGVKQPFWPVVSTIAGLVAWNKKKQKEERKVFFSLPVGR